jgi:hypothetical protein
MSNKPKCIIVTGRPASGKTTLSKKLGQRLHLPVISRDEIKAGYVCTFGVKHDHLPAPTNAIVSNFFFETAYHYLSNSVSIIIEAAFQHAVWATTLSRFLEISRPYLLVCALDGELATRRHVHRSLCDPSREFYHGDTPVSVYRATGEIPIPDEYRAPDLPVPTLQVLTEQEYIPSLDEIVAQLQF